MKKIIMLAALIAIFSLTGLTFWGMAAGKSAEARKGSKSRTVDVTALREQGVFIERIDQKFSLMLVNQDPYSEIPQESCCANWFLLGERQASRLTLNTEMGLVDGMAASASREHLAIWSHGEGHPCVEVKRLPPLVNNSDQNVYSACNSYGSRLSFDRWEGDLLLLNSTMPLDRMEGGLPYCVLFQEDQTYQVEFPGGKVTGVSPGAKDPVAYWSARLNDDRSDAICALGALGDPRAIAPLKKALATEKDPEVRKQIEETIKDLESRE